MPVTAAATPDYSMPYLFNRLGMTLLVLFGTSVLIFAMVRLLPGDVVTMIIGAEGAMSAGQEQRVRAEYGLDQSWPVQYGRWVGGVLQGNLGRSFRTNEPVGSLLLGRLPTTLQLALFAVGASALIGVPLGVASALARDGRLDLLVRLVGLIGLSVPSFWLATILVMVAAFGFRWSPPLIYVPPTRDLAANLGQMLLPTIALAAGLSAIVVRMTRSAVLEVLNEEYVRTAYAKGLRRPAVVAGHVLRNAALPVVTILGLQAGYLFGGVVVIEQIFGLPGIGWTLLNAINQRDYPVVQGAVLFFALVFALFNLLVDLAYGYLDPRIRRA